MDPIFEHRIPGTPSARPYAEDVTPSPSQRIVRAAMSVFTFDPTASPLPRTPVQKTISSVPAPGASPLVTPARRFPLKRKHNRKWSSEKCFTPITRQVLKQYETEGREVIYSLKGDSEGDSFRYAGTTQRPLKRTAQHASEANNPTSSSKLARAKKALQQQQKASLSIGILAVSNGQRPNLEQHTLEKCTATYQNVINQRRGGGGGSAMKVASTMSDIEVTKELQKLAQNHTITARITKKEGRLQHTLSREERTEKKVIYIFERTLSSGKTKRLVGMTAPSVARRLSSHMSYINRPERSTRKNKTFYKEANRFWNQFSIKVIPVGDLVARGATMEQIETIAIRLFRGMEGYNQNRGGGGGAVKIAN